MITRGVFLFTNRSPFNEGVPINKQVAARENRDEDLSAPRQQLAEAIAFLVIAFQRDSQTRKNPEEQPVETSLAKSKRKTRHIT